MEALDTIGLRLIPMTKILYGQTLKMGWLLLAVFFLMGIVFVYFKTPQGSIDFIDLIKRLIIAMLLLISFPSISFYIQDVAQSMTESISNDSGFRAFFDAAKTHLDSLSGKKSWSTGLFFMQDMFLSLFANATYFLVLLSRHLMMAIYHFYWALLVVLAPIMIAFYIFRQSANVTSGLFKSLIEVAMWPFVWEIMGAMLKTVWLGEKTVLSGDYLTTCLLNIIIALAMIFTPYLVHSIVSSGLAASASAMSGLTAAAVITIPAKANTIFRTGQALMGVNKLSSRSLIDVIHSTAKKLRKVPPKIT